MPFREKKAWITLGTLALVSTLFVILMGQAFGDSALNIYSAGHLILVALITFVVVEAGLLLLARWQSPEDARMPKDEREYLIDLKAARVAYVALIVLLLLVTLLMLHSHGHILAWGLHYLLAIVAAEMVRAVAQIVLFRRGG